MKNNIKPASTLLALGMMVVVCAMHAPVSAQTNTARSEEARGLHDAGTLAFEDGRFEDALERWQAAHALVQLPQLLFNIGTAYDRLGQTPEALGKYNAYLEALPEAENANYVRRRIAVLEVQVAEANAREIVTEDSNPTSDTNTPDAGDPHPNDNDTDEGVRLDDAPSANDQHGTNVPAIVLTATGGALLIAGVVTGLMTNARYASLEETCPDGRCTVAQQANIDSLSTFALTTDILLIVGGAATVTGLVWWLLGGGEADGENSTDETVQLHIGPQSVAVTGHF